MNKLNLKYIIILSCIIFSSTCFAQQKSFDTGIEGGPSAIILRGNPNLNKMRVPTVGFSGGIFFQFNFINGTSLRTNVWFEEKGTGTSQTLTLTNLTGNTIGTEKTNSYIHYKYITAPLIFRKYFGSKSNYFINAGPYIGYLFGINSGTDNPMYPGYLPAEKIEYYKKIDGGIIAGLGFAIPFKTLSISLELRNNLGLIDIYYTSIYSDNAIRTNSTNLLVGLSYPLWKKQLTEKDFDYR